MNLVTTLVGRKVKQTWGSDVVSTIVAAWIDDHGSLRLVLENAEGGLWDAAPEGLRLQKEVE